MSDSSVESPTAKQPVARPVKKGNSKSSLAYRPLEDGNDSGEGTTDQREAPDQRLAARDDVYNCESDGGSMVQYDGFCESQIADGGEPGLFGADGLLSMPKMKALLLLVFVAQVRSNQTVK